MATKYGTNSGDNLYATVGADSIFGWDQTNAAGDFGPATDNDRLHSFGHDLLSGGGGDDTLYGGSGRDTLLGGTGDDVLIQGTGATSASQFDGGAGIDLFVSEWFANIALDLSVLSMQKGVTLGDGSTVKGVEAVFLHGSLLADSVLGGLYDDTIYGEAGNDVLRGGDGDDLLYAGAGTDSLFGGNGDDTLAARAEDGADDLRGGLGIDVLAYNAEGGTAANFTMVLGYSVTMGNGTTATGFERLNYVGTTAVDKVTGGNWDDTIEGGTGGKDVLTGRDGNDFLISGRDSNDAVTLYGGNGDDTLGGMAMLSAGTVISGGAGTDMLALDFSKLTAGMDLSVDKFLTIVAPASGATIKGIEDFEFIGSDHDDKLTGGLGDDLLIGNWGSDTLSGGAGTDSLDGGLGNDTLLGGDGNDVLTDAQGSNVIFGAGGDDVLEVGSKAAQAQFLYGGDGKDSLTGGLGGDVLNGGAGSDVLVGAAGADSFTFNTAPVLGEVDSIADFVSGTDSISLKASAFAGLAVGDLARSAFVLGTAALDAGDRILYDKATGGLWYDADGTGAVAAVKFADLVDGTTLVVGDFLIV